MGETEMQNAADMAYLSVLTFGPCTDRNTNSEHCAVRSVILTLWSKHRSDIRSNNRIIQ